ncbi:MAG: iron-containing alcohol dehydrogenase [Firmicutes bacterium]|nr:iron-containing alcohol dehydrogenase [Bacillota bacterium]
MILKDRDEVIVDRIALPHAARAIWFGRGLLGYVEGARVRATLGSTERLQAPKCLIVVGGQSSKAVPVADAIDRLEQVFAIGEMLQVSGRADHSAIRSGVNAARRAQADVVIAVGGGTTLDVGKAVSALAKHDNAEDVEGFQTGRRQINTAEALPWIAVPTTSGTGAESTNNAVIELGNERRSIRGIPPPKLIMADPALTDSLPFAPTAIAAVDALSQALEVLTSAHASPIVQSLSIEASVSLIRGIQSLIAAGADVEPSVRDTLSWGSLLMGVAFAHARLGIPHALVHYCARFGLAHGHMVGILLPSAMRVQARQPGVQERLSRLEWQLPEMVGGVLEWLDCSVPRLLAIAGLPTSLSDAHFGLEDLEWIVQAEMAHEPTFGIPEHRADRHELLDVLSGAF